MQRQRQRLAKPGFYGQQHEPALFLDTARMSAQAVEITVTVLAFAVSVIKGLCPKPEIGGIHTLPLSTRHLCQHL